ncbi:MAG: YIP1 family protein [Methanomicrobia archaeon]|nr:YIP1 family protein [Methanomicrobia archaeon]
MWERITGFLFSPSTTFDASKGDTLGDALKYFVIIMAIYAIFIAIIATVTFSLLAGMLELFGAPIAMPFGAALGPAAAIIFFSAALIGGIIGSFITGLWLHLWVYLVGGRKGLEKTIIALLYGQTPYLLLGWIPIINFIALLWTIIVEIIGVRQLHELTTGKAVIAVILALIIPLIVFGVLFAVFFMPLMHGPVGYGPSIVPRMGGSL